MIPAMKYPVLAIHRTGIPVPDPNLNDLSTFADEDDLTIVYASDLRRGTYLGMTLIDSDLQRWKVVSTIDLGLAGGFWGKLIRACLGTFFHRVDLRMERLPSQSLDELKALLEVTMRDHPVYWWGHFCHDNVDEWPEWDDVTYIEAPVAAMKSAQSIPEIIEAILD